jgi:drug/metabolite transporter (DMT)-like permease
VLLPFVVVLMRGRWNLLLAARWPVLGMGLVSVAVTQVLYFAAIARIPVATELLIEYLAPLILVGFTWAVSRKTAAPVVLIGSVLAVDGLVLGIEPGAIQAVDPLGWRPRSVRPSVVRCTS